jgi:uncharacterized protein YjbI with pentapeptide repeats
MGAQLQGARLDEAQLQGARLDEAQLQGAALVGAVVNATDFSNAFLWRTDWGKIGPANLGAVRLNEATTWEPIKKESTINNVVPGPVTYIFSSEKQVPWNANAYAELRDLIDSIPEGETRDAAQRRIERLDCTNPDKSLASCDPAATLPPDVSVWQQKLNAASVDNATYAKELATELRNLVCATNVNAVHIWRGIIEHRGFAETGRETPALVDFIMSKDCHVSASLTDDDKAGLLRIKQDAEKKFPPPAESKQEK